MSHEMLLQPDGQIAIWSSVVDDFIYYDCSPAQVLDHYVSEWGEARRSQIEASIGRALATGSSAPANLRHETFAEALTWRDEQHGPVETKDEPFSEWLTRVRRAVKR